MKPPTTPVEVDEVDLTPALAPEALQRPRPDLPRELGGRLAGLTLPQQVFALAVWPFLEQVLGFLVGFVDTVLAARLSVEAANAIGVASYVGWLIGLVQSSVGIGATAIIARAVGGRHRRLANAALGQAMLLALAGGIGIGLVVFALAPAVAWVTGLRGGSAAYCATYLRIIGAAAPLSALLFVGAASLRGAGDTRSPFGVLVVVNVVNCVFSVIFVAAAPPWGGHEVAGIAAGTFLGWLAGAVLMVALLASGRGGIRLRWLRLRPHAHTAWRIVRVGAPSLLESFLAMWIANFAVIVIVGRLGNPAAWGAHMIAIRLEALSFLPGFAIGIAAATLAGQYLGLGDPARARQAVVLCWRAGVSVMAVLGLVFILMPEPLVRLVTDQPALLQQSPALLRICGCVQVFFGTAIILGQGMRGAGDTRTTLWLTALSTYGVRLPAVCLLAVVLKLGLPGVWYGLCAELVFRGCIFAARFRHGGWMRAKV